jgi:hypothetical protein
MAQSRPSSSHSASGRPHESQTGAGYGWRANALRSGMCLVLIAARRQPKRERSQPLGSSKRWLNILTTSGAHGSVELATDSIASIKSSSQAVVGSALGIAERPISAPNTLRKHGPRAC